MKTSNGTPSGISVILTHPGRRFILTYPGTMVDLGYEDLDFDYIFSASHLHVSSFFLHRRLRPQIADMFRAARSRGLTTSMDTNDDPEDKWSDDNDLVRTFGFVGTLFLNEREAKKLARTNNLTDAMAKLAQLTKRVVVKLALAANLYRSTHQL